MTAEEIEELRQLIDDEDSSDDAILEWCLERGGYIEVIANLLERTKA